MEKSSRVEHYSVSKGDILVTTYALGKDLCEECHKVTKWVSEWVAVSTTSVCLLAMLYAAFHAAM